MRRPAIVILVALPLAGCAQHRMFVSSEFASITSAHHKVAILPFHVSIARDGLPRNITPQDKLKLEQEEGFALQTQLYTQLLEQSGQFTVRFQDIAETNALLEHAGFTYETLSIQDKQDVARALGVDGVISARVFRSKPNTSAELIVGALLGPPGAGFGNTNEVCVDLLLHNASDGALLWTFRHKLPGGIGSSTERMTRSLLSSIARRFPYARTES